MNNWLKSSLTGTTLSEEPDSEDDHVCDHASPSCMEEENEVSGRESAGPDKEELLQDVDQEVSEKQFYRETITAVSSFMGWKQVPEFDSASSTLDDNPFAGTRSQPTVKVSVKVQVDEWLTGKWNYINPHRNLYLMEALHQLVTKNAVEPVTIQTSLGF